MSYFFGLNSNGEPEKPLIVHVGRLGVEKSLDFLKRYYMIPFHFFIYSHVFLLFILMNENINLFS